MLKISDKLAKEMEQVFRPRHSKSRGFFIEHWLGIAIVLIVFAKGVYALFRFWGDGDSWLNPPISCLA